MTTMQMAGAGPTALAWMNRDRTSSAWPPAPRGDLGTLPLSRLRRVTEHIREHLDQHLTLAQLGAVVYMSPYHFARLFQRSTGVPPHRFVVRARIDRAITLLTAPEPAPLAAGDSRLKAAPTVPRALIHGGDGHGLDADRPPVDQIREALAAVVSDGNRAAEVLTRIRALLARSAVARQACQITAIVRDVVPLVRPELDRHGIALQMSLTPDLPPVRGDRIQLQQVVLNLLVNAAEAMREAPRERRRLAVRATLEAADDGPWVVVAVEDAGVGLREPDAARLFDPFYTTKRHGLGMGLSISRTIVVDGHAGRLWATANAEHGATFHVALPGAADRSSQ